MPSIENLSFPSSDGKHQIFAQIAFPNEEPRGVVQIVHGMIDHVGRYHFLTDALTAAGYIVAGNDHLGHGRTALETDDFGYFAPKDGDRLIVEDLKTMNDILHERFPDLPCVMFGHSMGSFLARNYILRYPDTADAAIFLGTGGPNPLLPLGQAALFVLSKLGGGRRHPQSLATWMNKIFNAHFRDENNPDAWLTSDTDVLPQAGSDRMTDFIFSTDAYRDLLRACRKANNRKWFANYPKHMPTLVAAGKDDPVGNFGKGPSQVYAGLGLAGVRPVKLKLYENARHEVFNEKCRETFFADVIAFIDEVTAK